MFSYNYYIQCISKYHVNKYVHNHKYYSVNLIIICVFIFVVNDFHCVRVRIAVYFCVYAKEVQILVYIYDVLFCAVVRQNANTERNK